MKKTTKANKNVNTKVTNASDIIIKSKDNRKISTIDKVAKESVKGISTKKALDMIDNANAVIENKTKTKAKGFYAIKVNEDNFKDWFENNCDDEKKIKGVKYNQASNLANMYNFVWCDKILSVYDSNKATLLVAYVRKDYAKVVSLHKAGKISETMKKADIEKVLKENFGGKSKTVKEGTSAKVKSENADLMEALAMVNHFIKKHAEKDGDIAKAWEIILNHCEH